MLESWRSERPELAKDWDNALSGDLADGWNSNLPEYKPEQGGVATREASGAAMNALAAHIPTFIGGDADLAPSTKTQLKAYGDFEPGQYDGRNIHFGVREHAMGALVNGIVLNGMTRAYGATFFTFSDYQRPTVRLASIMKIPSIFVYTHDSVLLGEDGPTHQPVEHLMSLRAMPGLYTVRPADANESVDAWVWAMQVRHRPMALIFSRQKLPVLDRSGAKGELSKGAYILKDAEGGKPDIILIGTGSEVSLCVGAADELAKSGVKARVVSFPSWELFEEQPEEYRNEVFPPDVTARVSVEAGVTLGWCKWIGPNGASVGIDHFGASAPAAEIAEHFGLTVDNVVKTARGVLGRGE
jgi:transketolase